MVVEVLAVVAIFQLLVVDSWLLLVIRDPTLSL